MIDIVITAALCGGAIVLCGPQSAWFGVDEVLAERLLTLSAAAVGCAAAILAMVASGLLDNPRPAWIASALVLYCIVVLPWTTGAQANLDPAHRAARLIAYLTALVLLLFSIRPPRPLGAWGGWVIMLSGGLLAVAALHILGIGRVGEIVDGPLGTVAVLAGWTAAAAGFVVQGYQRQSSPLARLGLGLVVLALAQLYRVASTGHGPGDLLFGALRLVGLVVVLIGAAQLVRRALGALRDQQWEQQEELGAAALHMQRASDLAAERDHELRNGLAGLAGIAHLLSSEADTEHHEQLRGAVLAELGRLHTLLGRPADGVEDGAVGSAPEHYLVEPVLAGLVALWSSRGGRIRLDVEPGLMGRGHSAVLAQVITNLLANCARHAPGAPVTVRSRLVDGGVTIEVWDQGPGLAADAEALFERGVGDEAAGGSGLGLHISRELLAREGGSLSLRTNRDPTGCVAEMRIPSASSPPVGRSSSDPAHGRFRPQENVVAGVDDEG
jgi:two-component system OmpR family sensor kinase